MKEYTYKNEEIEYARFLRVFTPKKIWWDFISYYFDYGDFYFQIENVSKIADSQNRDGDEAIIGEFTKENKSLQISNDFKLVCENKKIEQLYIVRTLLHFSDFKTYSKIQIQLNKVKARIKNLFKPNPMNELVEGISGIGEEMLIHPDSEEVKKLNPNYTNLVDCGLLLQIEGKFLKAFIEGNGFGFHVFQENFFLTEKEFKETAKGIKLIKI